ncbi:MAG: zinc-ribbon domain-containing protein [Alphaproteobacteria bacterium]|nr:zinc-ribbon domain-containing protein [Alphaproteobacteria bacterium]
MIVSCPNCATRFEVPESALGSAGRKVRCGQCAHLWLQRPDGSTEELEPPPTSQPEPEEPPVRDWEAPSLAEPAEDVHAEPAEAPPRRRRFGRGEDNLGAAAPRRSRRGVVAAVLALLVLAGIGAGVLLLRGDDDAAGSLMARVAAMLGAAREQPGQGLNFENVATARRSDAGVSILVVTGEVVNTTTEPRAVPPLRGSLLGADNKELQNWTFSASVERLEPGQRAKFETTLRQPTSEATDIKVTFSVPGG